jgi:hypothetical protein
MVPAPGGPSNRPGVVVNMAPTLTLSRAAVDLDGLPPKALQGPVPPPEAVNALAAVLAARGFQLTSPSYVRELPDFQGFRLAQ